MTALVPGWAGSDCAYAAPLTNGTRFGLSVLNWSAADWIDGMTPNALPKASCWSFAVRKLTRSTAPAVFLDFAATPQQFENTRVPLALPAGSSTPFQPTPT